MTEKLRPVHPGEILLEEFMKPMGISPGSLAEDFGWLRLRHRAAGLSDGITVKRRPGIGTRNGVYGFKSSELGPVDAERVVEKAHVLGLRWVLTRL